MLDATRLLELMGQGDEHAAKELLPLVYEELRRLAARKLCHEKPGQTLNATALVHEAYLRLVDVEKQPHWENRGHFFACAAEAMRRILIEQARRRVAREHAVGPVLRIDFAASRIDRIIAPPLWVSILYHLCKPAKLSGNDRCAVVAGCCCGHVHRPCSGRSDPDGGR